MSTRSTTYSTPSVIPGILRSTRPGAGYPWGEPVQLTEAIDGLHHTKSITSAVTVEFRKLLACGGLLPYNDVEIITTKRTYKPGSYQSFRPNVADAYTWDRGPAGYSSDFVFGLGDGFPSDAVITSMVNSAVADSRAAVMDALTFLAEFRQTQQMFKTAIERVGLYGAKAARNAWRFKDRASAFASLWLEYRYGWLPACYSLDDARRALMLEKAKYAYGKSSQTVTFNDSATIDISNTSYTDVTVETVAAQHIVRGWAASDISSPFGSTGWGLDPIKTAWELVPFSFVIDWFVQVGSWIDSVSPFTPGRLAASGVSIRSSISREATRVSDWLPASGNVGGLTTPQKVIEEIERYIRFSRDPSMPGWNPVITPKRIIDAVALAIATRLRVFKILFR